MIALLAVMLSAAPAAPTLLKVDLAYMLTAPGGRAVAKEPQQKTWFFEVPHARAGDAAMRELLHRIFFDTNTMMKAQEPGDPNWLALTSFKSSPVDPKSMLSIEKADDLSWAKADRDVIWEPSCCFIVDDKGSYDTLKGHELTELLAYRLVHAKALDEAGFVAYFDSRFPGKKGKPFFDDRATRFKNLTAIRDVPGKRKPGSKPEASWVEAGPAQKR